MAVLRAPERRLPAVLLAQFPFSAAESLSLTSVAVPEERRLAQWRGVSRFTSDATAGNDRMPILTEMRPAHAYEMKTRT
ncbi:hypothetical protein FHT76_002620 [Rhizobium sp. BK176]|nr:hypothetical protein [Rhizobium sp. BK399]MCS3739826.1 hypothetical protein [Rhizobium sp. BK661]MCS4090968.1 hypothetical protein [Rhizobium sp. BK176]